MAEIGKKNKQKLDCKFSPLARPWPAWGWLLVLALGTCAVGQGPGITNSTQVAENDAAGSNHSASEPQNGHPSAESPAATLGEDWVRLAHEDDEVVGMETAIVRYVERNAAERNQTAGSYVDLIGAIHVGDKSYYDELNRRFTNYDALLYELVAPDGTVVQPGRGTSSAHPLGALQNGMKHLLELEHQLELIDYTKPNFIHADMSPDEFADSMRNRGESFLQMYFRLVGHSIGQQSRMASKGESLDLQLLSALFARDRARRFKLALAGQLDEMESLFLVFGGDAGSTLITERNKVALDVLREQIRMGKKKLGIFYGAGHLADMDQRLRTDFDMVPIAITWLRAWDLSE